MADVRKDCEKCQVGEIVTQEVVDIRSGVVLCGKGHVLTEESILRFKKFGISEIYVQKQDWDKVWNINERHLIAYTQTIGKMKDILEATRIKNSMSKQEIDELSEQFFEVLDDNSTIMGCVNRLKDVNAYTHIHSLNVGMLAVLLGRWLQLPKESLNELYIAGMLHDVGKYKIPSAILNKRGALTPEELKVMKTHAQISYELVKNMPDITPSMKEGILAHHERCDGSGYPRQLKENNIPLYGKILAVVDMYDAMISERVYKRKETPFEVMEHLLIHEVGKLDTHILLTFLKNIANYYIGVKVRLSTHEDAEVVFIPSQCIYRPIVRVGEAYIDLSQRVDIRIVDIV